jgi:ribosomal protein L37AE/L43A
VIMGHTINKTKCELCGREVRFPRKNAKHHFCTRCNDKYSHPELELKRKIAHKTFKPWYDENGVRIKG